MTDQPSDRPARRVLLVAFHFPPLAGSSGIQRTLGMVRHLSAHGWEPLVLSADPRAYDRVSDDLLREVPASVPVARSFALDTARHLRLFGRYPGFLARPDRWRSWLWSAVPAGLRLIEQYRPQLIWSTYPIATAHAIGAALCRRSGLPWVADFRDPMAQEGYPADPKTWQSFRAIEDQVAERASRMVFVTPSAMQTYVDRYPTKPRDQFAVIENGYDEALFQAAEARRGPANEPIAAGRLTLLHSGIVYPSERDPTQLFAALRALRDRGVVAAENFCLRFRAPVHDELLWRLADQTGTRDLIEVLPAVPYGDALAEMMRTDALVVMQGANCNEQIPAKVYEYLRARRPMVGLADPIGETARVMRDAGVGHIAKLEDAAAVEQGLGDFVQAMRAGRSLLPHESAVTGAARSNRVRQTAALFDAVVASGR